MTPRTAAIATFCACVIGASSGAAAQGRFELLSGDAVASAQGLGIYTLRDNRMAVCYTLFVLGGIDADSSRSTLEEPSLTAADLDKVRVAETLKEAVAIRDRKLAELESSKAFTWGAQSAFARDRIEDEYESAVRSVLPRLYPLAPIVPGLRSTSPDSLNNAVRQAIADADAAVAAAARAALDDRMLQLLNRIARSRLAVAGPAACSPSTGAR